MHAINVAHTIGRIGRGTREVVGSAALWLAAAVLLGCSTDASHEMARPDAAAPADADAALEDAGDADPRPIVEVQQGRVRGALAGDLRVFLGIPYAQSTAGELRFAPPKPAEPWASIRNAFSYAPACPQPHSSLRQSEDCLALNVFAPADAQALPVMVFIHGGAFISGWASLYDPSELARKGHVIAVTIQYRLGPLGFLSLPALDAERGAEPSGNDALRDQQLALRWVQDNIEAFGGDPQNVTLFGESAGGVSTCMHMVSPRSQGLAARYVMQSGSCAGGIPISKKSEADALGAELAEHFCADELDDVVSCLRTKTAVELVEWESDRTIAGAGWYPVINPQDDVLPEHPLDAIEAGRFNPGPIIIGSTAHEWGLYIDLRQGPGPVGNVADLHRVIDELPMVPDAAALKELYPATDATALDVFSELMTDKIFRCPSRALARAVAARGQDAYLYSFDVEPAYHTAELAYVLGNFAVSGPPEPSLRDAVQRYWTDFAQDGDPNRSAEVVWPLHDEREDRHLVLDLDGPVPASGLAREACDYWATSAR